MEVFTFIIEGIGKAFGVMNDYVFLPSLSILSFSVILLLPSYALRHFLVRSKELYVG